MGVTILLVTVFLVIFISHFPVLILHSLEQDKGFYPIAGSSVLKGDSIFSWKGKTQLTSWYWCPKNGPFVWCIESRGAAGYARGEMRMHLLGFTVQRLSLSRFSMAPFFSSSFATHIRANGELLNLQWRWPVKKSCLLQNSEKVSGWLNVEGIDDIDQIETDQGSLDFLIAGRPEGRLQVFQKLDDSNSLPMLLTEKNQASNGMSDAGSFIFSETAVNVTLRLSSADMEFRLPCGF